MGLRQSSLGLTLTCFPILEIRERLSIDEARGFDAAELCIYFSETVLILQSMEDAVLFKGILQSLRG